MDFLHASVTGLVPVFAWPTFGLMLLGMTRRTAAICGWILGMYAVIWLLGFSLATLVTTLVYLRTARERWPISIALSIAGFAFVYGLFAKALSVPFPPGQPLVWLGGAAEHRL